MSTSVQEYSKTDAALADLASRYKGAVFDVKSSKGMVEAKAARAELRGYRIALEKVRVEIKAPALERCRLIDAEAKRIGTALSDLEDPIDNIIKSEEKRKEREAMEKVMENQRRIDAIRAKVEAIRTLPATCVGKNSERIAGILAQAQKREIGDDYAEFRAEAEEALTSCLAQLSVMLSGAQAQEAEAERIKAEREELAKLRAEQVERERANREAFEAEQREARAKIEAEERAAREARAAEDAKLSSERAAIERERRAAEETQRAEEAKAETARRELQRRENELLDAQGMLRTFKARFGHITDFASVIVAIDQCLPKKARKVA